MDGKLILISEVRDPNGPAASSTQIMTKNILNGLKSLDKNTVFIAIKNECCSQSAIYNYYNIVVDNVVIVNGILNNEKVTNKYKGLFQTMKAVYFSKAEYRKVIGDIIRIVEPGDTIITHSPSVEAAAIGALIKERIPNIRFVQYWGDPIALSLITPEQMGINRYPALMMERKLHRSADKIVYGTKTLMLAQNKIHPNDMSKSFYCDVPCSEESEYIKNEKLIFGYIGNYYSNIRNIRPLYDAFCDMSDMNLVICGSGNVELNSTGNIEVMRRVPQSKVETVEKHIDVEICLLNTAGIQIPGKIFYHTNSDRIILILLDGPIQDEIRNYLESFERFEFCNNDVKSIKEKISEIIKDQIRTIPDDRKQLFSPVNVARQIIK